MKGNTLPVSSSFSDSLFPSLYTCDFFLCWFLNLIGIERFRDLIFSICLQTTTTTTTLVVVVIFIVEYSVFELLGAAIRIGF